MLKFSTFILIFILVSSDAFARRTKSRDRYQRSKSKGLTQKDLFRQRQKNYHFRQLKRQATDRATKKMKGNGPYLTSTPNPSGSQPLQKKTQNNYEKLPSTMKVPTPGSDNYKEPCFKGSGACSR